MGTIKISRLPVRTGMVMVAMAIGLAAFSPASAGASPRGVVPSMSVSPGAGPAGSQVAVGGNLGRPGPVLNVSEPVAIYFDRTLVGKTYTDWFHSFSATITIPANASPGAHKLQAIGRSSGLSVWAIFTVSQATTTRPPAASPPTAASRPTATRRPDPR